MKNSQNMLENEKKLSGAETQSSKRNLGNLILPNLAKLGMDLKFFSEQFSYKLFWIPSSYAKIMPVSRIGSELEDETGTMRVKNCGDG